MYNKINCFYNKYKIGFKKNINTKVCTHTQFQKPIVFTS